MPEPTISPDEVLELARKATEGPWSRSWIAGAIRHINRNVDFDAFWFPTDEEKKNRDAVNYPQRHEPDYDFIATARTALPAYAEALKVAEAALRETDNLAHELGLDIDGDAGDNLRGTLHKALSRIHALVKFGGTT